MLLDNPYLDAFYSIVPKNGSNYHARPYLTSQYAWAVPSNEVILYMASISTKIVEMGAGLGYWAGLLKQAGADVTAFDNFEWSTYWKHSNFFHPVEHGEPDIVSDYADHALLLVWPPYDNTMAYQTLNHYLESGGKDVFYVGEGEYGCTGCNKFHDLLNQLEPVHRITIPQFNGIHDRFWHYRA